MQVVAQTAVHACHDHLISAVSKVTLNIVVCEKMQIIFTYQL